MSKSNLNSDGAYIMNLSLYIPILLIFTALIGVVRLEVIFTEKKGSQFLKQGIILSVLLSVFLISMVVWEMTLLV